MRHQINTNWVYDIPVGQGRSFGSDMGGVLNNIIGGWQITGIVRVNSGPPVEVFNGRVWATNWNVAGNAQCTGGPVFDFSHSVVNGPCAPTQNVNGALHTSNGTYEPNLFTDPDGALDFFRHSNAGERGQRNPLRADAFMNLDFNIGKTFVLPAEGHSIKFRFSMFNATNSIYFDATSVNASRGSTSSFGNYTAQAGAPRTMQMSLNYEF
jgi:hypothetical protein